MLHLACLPAEMLLLTAATFSSSRHHHQDVEMARLVALRYGGESESVPGCLFDGTGTLHHLFSATKP